VKEFVILYFIRETEVVHNEFIKTLSCACLLAADWEITGLKPNKGDCKVQEEWVYLVIYHHSREFHSLPGVTRPKI